MADSVIKKIPDIIEYNVTRTMFQTYSSKRTLIWFYDSYTNDSNYHGYRLDINGETKTLKYEEVTSGQNPTTLFTITGS